MVEISSIECLKPHNYYTWKPQITDLLMSKGLGSTLDDTILELTQEYKNFAYRNKMDEAM